MKKHAFLIMAHNQYPLLAKLVSLLDDERADIYLHIDKRSKKPEGLSVQRSKLYFIKSKKIYWGGYSQIDCELRLLKAALPQKYEYYHLLSGSDLPLKTNDELNAFFDEHKGENFISFDPRFVPNGAEVDNKLRYYRFWQDGGKRNVKRICNKLSLALQRALRVNHLKKIKLPIRKGANWFSITHDLAAHVLANESTVKKYFRYAYCPDEMFLHTLATSSPFCDSVVNDALRYTDWSGEAEGHPKTLTGEDYEKFMGSGAFFARKFSLTADSEVVERVCAQVKRENEGGKA